MRKVFDSRDEEYRFPYGAVMAGTGVRICFCAPLSWGVSAVYLVARYDLSGRFDRIRMERSRESDADVYRATIKTGGELGPVWYHFELARLSGHTGYYGATPEGRGGEGMLYGQTPPAYQLTIYDPSYQTPDWFGRGVTYQIFPDRFARAGALPDVSGFVGERKLHEDWYETPEFLPDQNGEVKNNDFFGGNLKGVEEKLPYLHELGVSAIYFSPIFEAASNHRYDTADYKNIDPLFGDENAFKSFCEKARSMGIRVILDGVFNHTGFNSRYFNGKGFYPEPGAFQSQDSKYYPWYDFSEWPHKYSSWWGIYTLPQVNESNPDYMNYIIDGEDSVIRKWLRLGASGWRLDVADEMPDEFISRLRTAARETRGDAIIIGEVWEDASNKISYGKRRKYLLGDCVDSVMNYPFRNAALSYLLGGDAREFMEQMEYIRENYPQPAFQSLMNFLGTHDTPRALTVLGCDPASYSSSKEARAALRLTEEQLSRGIALLRLGAALQFAFPGSPCIYYGDEAGAEGYEDPFNRRTYPWGRENNHLLAWYARLGKARRNSEALRSGDIRYLYAKDGLLVFERNSRHERIVLCLNRDDTAHTINITWDKAAAMDFLSGHSLRALNGALELKLEPLSAMLII